MDLKARKCEENFNENDDEDGDDNNAFSSLSQQSNFHWTLGNSIID